MPSRPYIGLRLADADRIGQAHPPVEPPTDPPPESTSTPAYWVEVALADDDVFRIRRIDPLFAELLDNSVDSLIGLTAEQATGIPTPPELDSSAREVLAGKPGGAMGNWQYRKPTGEVLSFGVRQSRLDAELLRLVFTPAERLVDVGLAQLTASSFNPRADYGPLEELAASLQQHGLLQPVVVRAQPDGTYELIAGHRRTAAARSLEWKTIPAIVREADQDEAHLLTLVENLQRDDLSPREQARGLEALLRERGWNNLQVAEAIGRSTAFVSKRLRVFDDPILAPYVLTERLSTVEAEELLPLPAGRKRQLAEQAAAERWSRADIRSAMAGDRRPSRRPHGLAAQLRKLRRTMDQMFLEDFTDADRAELLQWVKSIRRWATRPRPRTERRIPVITASGRTYLPGDETLPEGRYSVDDPRLQPADDLSALAARITRESEGDLEGDLEDEDDELPFDDQAEG